MPILIAQGKSYKCMQLEENELAKARLAKILLSNSTAKDRLEYHYRKPFENLVKNLTTLEWRWKQTYCNHLYSFNLSL